MSSYYFKIWFTEIEPLWQYYGRLRELLLYCTVVIYYSSSLNNYTSTPITKMAQAAAWKLKGQAQPRQERGKIVDSLIILFLGIFIGRFANPHIVASTSTSSSTATATARDHPSVASDRSTASATEHASFATEQNTTGTADRPSFAQLAEASGSDKYYLHHYEHYYSKWLAPYRAHPDLKIVEIGARDGKSLTLWDDYFESPQLILGLAYDAKRVVRTVKAVANGRDKVKLLFGDQSQPSTMKQVCENGPYNIIIDDGSHVPSHQVFSLYSLWSCLLPGGLYIVEDTETNYWDDGDSIYGYKLSNTGIGASPGGSGHFALIQCWCTVVTIFSIPSSTIVTCKSL
jgi:hypothetical protein